MVGWSITKYVILCIGQFWWVLNKPKNYLQLIYLYSCTPVINIANSFFSNDVVFFHRPQLVLDKEGIQIICEVPCVDGTFNISIKEKISEIVTISIKNNGSCSCQLVHCELLKRLRVFQLQDDQGVTESQTTMNILPGELS